MQQIMIISKSHNRKMADCPSYISLFLPNQSQRRLYIAAAVTKKYNHTQCDSNLGPLTSQSGALTTRLLTHTHTPV